MLWAGKLERLTAELRVAVTDQDDARLGRVCDGLTKLIGGEPTKINDRLVTTAKQLALGAVADKLRKICAQMTDVEFDEEAGMPGWRKCGGESNRWPGSTRPSAS